MLKKIIHTVTTDPFKIIVRLFSKFFIVWVSTKKNIEIKGKLVLVGYPLIDIQKGSALYIGHNVTLNSRNKGYHVNMHSPVKLYADKLGAEIHIGDNTRIHGACLHAYTSITIGKNCLIAANCQIFDGGGHDLSFSDVDNRIHTTGTSKPIVIEDSVWIGINSVILAGVTIGKGSVISANSVVVKDIPPMVLAGGNPAIIIKKYEGEKNNKQTSMF